MSNKNKKSLPGAIAAAAAIVVTVLGGTAAAQGPVDAVGLASSTAPNLYTPGEPTRHRTYLSACRVPWSIWWYRRAPRGSF